LPSIELNRLAATPISIRLDLGGPAEGGIRSASCIPACSAGLALLVGREAAVAAPAAEITSLDAKRIFAGCNGRRADRADGAENHQSPDCVAHFAADRFAVQ
jgi:hypothetical protein